MPVEACEINNLKKNLLDEIFKALGLGYAQPLRLLIEPLFSPAVRRFAKLAVSFDRDVNNYNFNNAARRLLPIFTREVRAHGTENIPAVGPLLIVSNHPGTVDGLVIASQLPRPDLKIITSGFPFIRNLAATAKHLIYSSFDTFERMKVVRAAVRHLRDGGAVLIFPSGGIDPDPAVMPGALAELETWSPSLNVILRRVPSARVLVTMVSGVLHPGWIHSPIVKIRSGRRNQQRAAEFFQIIQQMLFPNSLMVSPSVYFAKPISFALQNDGSSLPELIAAAKAHLNKFKE